MDISEINIKPYAFPDNQFIKEETKKTQIYLHHTVSGLNSAVGVANYFNSNPERVAVQIILNGDGTALQLYSTKYWGYHLGLTNEVFAKFKLPFQWLDKVSIGVEICAYGRLLYHDNKYWSVYGNEVPIDQVCILDEEFRGGLYYHKYTEAQIETLRKLLLYWKDFWNIPLDYNEDIWDLNKRALSGEPGFYTHCSVRSDKSDLFPHQPMIDMLKSL